MKGEVDSLVNFPIDTSLKTIAHSAMLNCSGKMGGRGAERPSGSKNKKISGAAPPSMSASVRQSAVS